MSERYQRLFELDKNMYVVGSPVVISAGAITKDNETGRVFIQLKIKNISDKAIKAVIASFSGYDVQKNNIGEKIVYEYLDLNCNFNEEIGAKIPVFLNNAGTRSFSADNIKVIFSDDNSCETDFSQAVSIPELEELSAEYDEDQLNQFKMQFSSNCKFLPQKYKDLFFCSCGAVNRSEKCGLCGYSISEMLAIDPEVLKNDGIYNKALDEVSKGKKENYEKAIKSFESIIDWKDSRAKIDECTAKIKDIEIAEEKAEAERKRKAEEAKITTEKARARNKKIAIIGGPIVAVLIVFLIMLNTVILPASNYKKALAAADAGNYNEAYSLFNKNPDYKDTKDQIASAKLKEATALLDAKKYDEAYEILNAIGNKDAVTDNMYARVTEYLEAKDYDSAYALLNQLGDTEKINESMYNRAVEFVNAGDAKAAYAIFIQITEYKDSKSKITSLLKDNPKLKYEMANVGDIVTFGKYYQSDSKTKEEIEWRVLAKEEGRILIISKYALDCQQYNKEYTSVTWETCTLRKWLNDTFLKAAFGSAEQSMIKSTKVTADNNPSYSTDPGNDTTDKVFLLSINEANKYFSSIEDRKCVPTAYAKDNGAWTYDSRGACWWWLRSPGHNTFDAALVNYVGGITYYGDYENRSNVCVRPALWIDFS